MRTHTHPVREYLYYFHNNIKTVLRPNRLRPYNVGMPVSLTSNPKAKIWPEREVRAYRVTLDFEKLRNDWTIIPVYYTTERIFSGDYWKVPKNVREYYENTGFPITDRDNFLTLIGPKETYAQESEWASFKSIENLHKYVTEMRDMEKNKKLSFEKVRDWASWEEDAWYLKEIPESTNVRVN